MASSSVVPIGFKVNTGDRLKVALDAMPVAVSWTRLDDGHVEFTNRRFVQTFGYRASDFADIFAMVDAMFTDPQVARTASNALRQVIGQNVMETSAFPDSEVLMRARDGRTLYTSFSGLVLPEANMTLGTFVDITASKEREALLDRLANEDALTGLLNRRAFNKALAAALAERTPFGLLVLDLDGFKAINDGLGHDVGDQALRYFGRLLREAVRKMDRTCRWGGDEFAVLLHDRPTRNDVDAVIDRLKQAMSQPVPLGSGAARLGVSAGYAQFPEDASDPLELWKVADARMFEDKRH